MLGTTDLRWPANARASVALAFDLDGPTGAAMLDGSIWQKPDYFTFGGYGPYRALPRLLDMLKAHATPATFFVPAWVVENWPRQCQAILEHGHEVAYHGYRHESFFALDLKAQREVMQISADIFKRYLGITATGFRTPSGDWHTETPALLMDCGVTYSSSMRGDDRPYFIDVPGQANGLVEIPGRWELDDYASLAYTRAPNYPAGLDRIASYDQTLDNWCREFDGTYREGLCMTTLFHPKISGKPGRILLLERFLEHMHSHPDVWFATCNDVASFWLKEHRHD
ncbi:polysaccharide deacetylase family protein [Pseudomonas sp. DSP3-2-2]|uniref:polysaccharide deacetylase family protein n=1 Tax=unclassified Pseudomonas TaxID=196821 RepID=UPI003CEB2382